MSLLQSKCTWLDSVIRCDTKSSRVELERKRLLWPPLPFAPNHRVELLIVSSFALKDWPTKEEREIMDRMGDGGERKGGGGDLPCVIKCTRGNDCHPAMRALAN